MRSAPVAIEVRTAAEDEPGAAWDALVDRFWPAYERWFLSEGELARPDLGRSRAALERWLPELVPLWTLLSERAGRGERFARFLSLYRPTPYLTACSQAVLVDGEPVLVRNYDYHPRLWEAVVLRTRWGRRRVLALSDCLWGALDGMNESGLAVSLSFGGRRVVGEGFGIPLVVRAVLETCASVPAALRVLRRVPSHMAYNVTVVDRGGDFATVYLAPDRPAIVRRWPLATNHQEIRDWEDYQEATASVEREKRLAERLGDPLLDAGSLVEEMLRPPLRRTDWFRGAGTLYTAVYRPRQGTLSLHWPGGRTLGATFDGFSADRLEVELVAEAAEPPAAHAVAGLASPPAGGV